MSSKTSGPTTGQKRKNTSTPSNARSAKRVQTNQARAILAQGPDKALNSNGELDVSAFVKAREFEIKAVEASMKKSKTCLSSRAFQQVPNELRRRTASHNVKKVPKRLRNRAAREMKVDNTPTVTSRRRKPTDRMRLRLETAKKLHSLNADKKKKRNEAKGQKPAETEGGQAAARSESNIPRPKKNKLSKPDQPDSKFRKRQKHKSWLPTHVFHAKRAHMTEPKHPLWRFAIPLTPTEKSYRKTHRAESLRGCVAWDMSYTSTIGLEGAEASLIGLLRDLGVDDGDLSGKRGVKWRQGSRSWQGWLRERDNEKNWIAKATIVWAAQEESSSTDQDSVPTKKKLKRRCLLRIHPSAFLQFWTELLKDAKIQRPPVAVEDLRFEIGSIEVIGPGSTEALVATLQPTQRATGTNSTSGVWSALGLLTNPSCLPINAIVSLDVSDPRLHYPPRTIEQDVSEASNQELLQTMASWSPDTIRTPASIFDRSARLTAGRLLPSQKAINRRKGDAPPGDYPSSLPSDPQIPVLLMTSRSPTAGAQGSWTLLLPWKCVLPVWYHIMHYPLSSGGNPRMGGLQEIRQVAFEQGIPWFPGDLPGSQAGWEWELSERAKRKTEWEKRPKGKRVAWESLDLGKSKKGEIGIGWACDWQYLFDPESASDPVETSQATTKDSSAGLQEQAKEEEAETDAQIPIPRLPCRHIPLPYSTALLTSSSSSIIPHSITTVHLTILSRGLPTVCARIYRLPTSDLELRSQWLTLASTTLHPTKPVPKRSTSANILDRKILASLPRNESHPLRTQQTALSLLHPHETNKRELLQPGNPAYPCVPDAEDLIGFVTTGNFDLGQGKASAVGSIALAKVAASQQRKTQEPSGKENDDSVTTDGESKRVLEVVEALEKGVGRKMVQRLCIVRESGESVGRLARWEMV
ncbi:MAG: hypothetical protein Q9174_004623 [Haloplaca sp. 1 TL-2023]